MMARTPFVDDEPMEIFQKAGEGIDSVELPEDKQWASLVRALCRPEPARRLPMLPEGLQQLQYQEWWAAGGFDWNCLEAQTMTPPHVPTLKGPDDLHNFNCSGRLRLELLGGADYDSAPRADAQGTRRPAQLQLRGPGGAVQGDLLRLRRGLVRGLRGRGRPGPARQRPRRGERGSLRARRVGLRV